MKFGEMPDGSVVERHRIEGGGLTAHVLSFGAVLQDLRLEGHDAPLVLGFEEFAPYLTDSPYFGATAGRCANRIGEGRFQIDGVPFQVDQNFQERHHLHGGAEGVGTRNWTVESVAADRITLRIELADGEMGYPGNMVARCTFACLEGGVFDVRLSAETDAPTLCNFAHHSYWNLDGGPTTDDHMLQLDADRLTVVDDGFIPVSMEMRSTEPGCQVYDGFKLDVGPDGLGGRRYGANAGVALEPQVWPDAVNHDTFPNAVLHAVCVFKRIKRDELHQIYERGEPDRRRVGWRG